jgi:hypothetical protein
MSKTKKKHKLTYENEKNEKKRLNRLGDAFFIVYKRQLTPKNIKKHQKASADENLTNLLPGL